MLRAGRGSVRFDREKHALLWPLARAEQGCRSLGIPAQDTRGLCVSNFHE